MNCKGTEGVAEVGFLPLRRSREPTDFMSQPRRPTPPRNKLAGEPADVLQFLSGISTQRYFVTGTDSVTGCKLYVATGFHSYRVTVVAWTVSTG